MRPRALNNEWASAFSNRERGLCAAFISCQEGRARILRGTEPACLVQVLGGKTCFVAARSENDVVSSGDARRGGEPQASAANVALVSQEVSICASRISRCPAADRGLPGPYGSKWRRTWGTRSLASGCPRRSGGRSSGDRVRIGCRAHVFGGAAHVPARIGGVLTCLDGKSDRSNRTLCQSPKALLFPACRVSLQIRVGRVRWLQWFAEPRRTGSIRQREEGGIGKRGAG